jgi:hypothetical protein
VFLKLTSTEPQLPVTDVASVVETAVVGVGKKYEAQTPLDGPEPPAGEFCPAMTNPFVAPLKVIDDAEVVPSSPWIAITNSLVCASVPENAVASEVTADAVLVMSTSSGLLPFGPAHSISTIRTTSRPVTVPEKVQDSVPDREDALGM